MLTLFWRLKGILTGTHCDVPRPLWKDGGSLEQCLTLVMLDECRRED